MVYGMYKLACKYMCEIMHILYMYMQFLSCVNDYMHIEPIYVRDY